MPHIIQIVDLKRLPDHTLNVATFAERQHVIGFVFILEGYAIKENPRELYVKFYFEKPISRSSLHDLCDIAFPHEFQRGLVS